MQNEPNFGKAQMNVNLYNTTDYEEKSNWTPGENEPKTNPIKPNCLKGEIDAKRVFTKDYSKKRRFRGPKKQSQFKANLKRAKMNLNFYSIKDYGNEPRFRPAGKQTQSKPISKAKKCCCV